MPVLDALGRPLTSLRISVTDRCNLRCHYCMPELEYVWLPRSDILTFEEIVTLVDRFCDLGVERVRITGGEPLLRRDLEVLVRLLALRPGIRDLALTTNGILLAEQVEALKAAGLHRLTVSLDTLREDRFVRLTRFEALAQVLEGIEAVSRAGLPNLKLDTVVLRGINDDELFDLIEYGRRVSAEVRFIEYMDVGGATQWTPDAVVTRSEILTSIERRYGRIEPIRESHTAPADRFALPDGTTFGVISSTSQPFCRTCDRSRLTADGIWLRCLYAVQGTDLRGPLRAGVSSDELRDLIRTTWENRDDRGAEERLATDRRTALIPVSTLRQDAHLEMHTRGG